MRFVLSVIESESQDAGWTTDPSDWGTWDFVSLPRAGDMLELNLDGRDQLLIVERVIHFIVQHPLPRTEKPYMQRREPAIRIVARRLSRAESPRQLSRQWQMLA